MASAQPAYRLFRLINIFYIVHYLYLKVNLHHLVEVYAAIMDCLYSVDLVLKNGIICIKKFFYQFV